MDVLFTYDKHNKVTTITDNTIYADRTLVDVVVLSGTAAIAEFEEDSNVLTIPHSLDGVYSLQVKVFNKGTEVEVDASDIHYQLVIEYSKAFLKDWLKTLLHNDCHKLPVEYVEIQKQIRAAESFFYAKTLHKVEHTINNINHGIYHVSPNQSYIAHPSVNWG